MPELLDSFSHFTIVIYITTIHSKASKYLFENKYCQLFILTQKYVKLNHIYLKNCYSTSTPKINKTFPYYLIIVFNYEFIYVIQGLPLIMNNMENLRLLTVMDIFRFGYNDHFINEVEYSPR